VYYNISSLSPYFETAEIVLINPPILGGILSWGTPHLDHPVKPDDDRKPPDPQQKVSYTSFSAVSLN
jgi:hypothetical protein